MRFFINVKQWNDKTLYSAPLNGKSMDNTECCYFLSVRFAKCTPPTKNVHLNVDYGFMSSFKKQDGTTSPELVIMRWSEIQSEPREETQSEQPQQKPNAKPIKEVPMVEVEEDLPF